MRRFDLPKGRDYFSAMNCAANTASLLIAKSSRIRFAEAFATVFGQSAEALGMELVYATWRITSPR